MANNQPAFIKYLNRIGKNARLYGTVMNRLEEGDGYDTHSGITIKQMN